MSVRKKVLSSIDVDLAFHGFLEKYNDEDMLLINSETWRKKLISWIEFVRNNDKEFCPKIIRQVNYISIGLHFTDDESIAKINHQWRQQSEPTDVLSFPVIDESSLYTSQDHCVELGDIFVSVQTAKKQAAQNNHSLAKELCWLVSHGLLHLLGWDHPTDSSLDEMLNFQDKLLKIHPIQLIADHTGIEH